MEVDVAVSSLKEYGFCVIENYWSNDKCRKAVEELSSVDSLQFEKGQGGDLRLQHAESHLTTAKDFLEDSFIQEVASQYSYCNFAHRIVGGIVRHIDGANIDSGGGWHVDSEQESQFKSFMYLSDVGTDNGPFTIVQKSKRLVPEIPKHSNLRIRQEHVEDMFESSDIIEIIGKAGTCILIDSTYVHRGKQIENGTRLTYTTYFYPKK